MAKLPGWDKETSPFHAGEQAMQESVGVRDIAEKAGRIMIRSYMPDQHRDFYTQLPFMVVGSIDGDGDIWASILAGHPGFVGSPDAEHLQVNARPINGDPLGVALEKGAQLGLLGIELETRRRNRLNATVTGLSDDGITLKVDQSFGNCPKYIQTRNHHFARDPSLAFDGAVEPLTTLSDNDAWLIQTADTFFVASAPKSTDDKAVTGPDVSHRGGKPGFVKVTGNTLTVPDFSGNRLFNTLGNFLSNPKAGLLFFTPENGDMLSLTGTVEIITDETVVSAYAGAERAWQFHMTKGMRLKGALPLRWTFNELSPYSQIMGEWS